MQFECELHRFHICNLRKYAETVIQNFLLSSKNKYRSGPGKYGAQCTT